MKGTKMKNTKFFFVLLPILWGCGKGPSEPIIPISSIKITSTTVEVIGTTVIIKSTVVTNKRTTISVKYGIQNYTGTVNATPDPVYGNASVSAKISDLDLGTTYKFKIEDYESSFTTKTINELKFGDNYKKGVIIREKTDNVPGLIAAVVDLTPTFGVRFNYFAATEAAKNYGEGYRLPDSGEAKLIKKYKNLGILTNFVDPSYDSRGIYITSTTDTGNTNYIYCLQIFNMSEKILAVINKNSNASSRAVCEY